MTSLAWLTPFLLALPVIIGMTFGGVWTWSGLVVLFVLHPILDSWIGKTQNEQTFDEEVNLTLIGYVPFQVAYFAWACWCAINARTNYEFIGISLSTGLLTGALGITAAHELIHRAKRKERALGVFLLCMVNYGHFRIEHIWGHHRWVATDKDPASSKKNQSLYNFLFQTYIGSYLSAWKIENKNRASLEPAQAFFSHRMLHYTLFMFGSATLIFYLGGTRLLGFWILQSFVATLLLEVINYIEHYGLRRGKESEQKYEAVGPQHSWDCEYALTNFSLYNLGKHSHHHWKAAVQFQDLLISPNSPKLPMGYSAALILAFVPPLWKKIMNPHIPQ